MRRRAAAALMLQVRRVERQWCMVAAAGCMMPCSTRPLLHIHCSIHFMRQPVPHLRTCAVRCTVLNTGHATRPMLARSSAAVAGPLPLALLDVSFLLLLALLDVPLLLLLALPLAMLQLAAAAAAALPLLVVVEVAEAGAAVQEWCAAACAWRRCRSAAAQRPNSSVAASTPNCASAVSARPRKQRSTKGWAWAGRRCSVPRMHLLHAMRRPCAAPSACTACRCCTSAPHASPKSSSRASSDRKGVCWLVACSGPTSFHCASKNACVSTCRCSSPCRARR